MSHADRPGWQAWARRVVLFAVLWWALTDGATGAWLFGIPVILLGAWTSLLLWTRQPLSLFGLARFLPYFVLQSLAGATDVARRALDPAMPLCPGLVRHRLRLPAGAARIGLANVISMLPGTLSADLAGDEVLVHALDTRNDVHAMVLDLEPRIAAVFGVALPPLPAESASC
jgi:multicomponent Na+:H+ antiporter subunit E